MSKKHFSWLLAVTVVVAALVLLVPGKTGRESTFEKTALLPDLASVVNEIQYIRLTGAGGAAIATLSRGDSGWTVAEASGYAANWPRLKQLLADLSVAEVIEEKTSNPEYYFKLGVEDVSSPEATGVQVEFAEDSGIPAVIIGKEAQGREGTYVRLAGSPAGALADRNFDVFEETSEWLEREIVDITDDEVVEVEISHPDGEQVKAVKVSADDSDFELQNIPGDREISSKWTVNSIAGGLASLSLDAVAPEQDFDWSQAIRFRMVTADGLLLSADLLAQEDQRWIRLEAGEYESADTPAESPQKIDAEAEKDADTETEIETEAETETETAIGAATALARVERINGRVSGWAYRIPQYKFDVMTKRMEDLLKETGES